MTKKILTSILFSFSLFLLFFTGVSADPCKNGPRDMGPIYAMIRLCQVVKNNPKSYAESPCHFDHLATAADCSKMIDPAYRPSNDFCTCAPCDAPGACISPAKSNSYGTLQDKGFGMFCGTSAPYATPPRCDGRPANCCHVCEQPSCPSGDGYTWNLRTETKPPDLSCDTKKGGPNASYEGNIRCDDDPSTPDNHFGDSCSYGPVGNELRYCVRQQGCSELTNGQFPTAYKPGEMGGESSIFIPDAADDINGRNGDPATGMRCGATIETSTPWWQVVNGNIYANQGIDRKQGSACASPADRYVIARNGDNPFQAGLLQKQNGNFPDPGNRYTQRNIDNTTVTPANFNLSADKKQDFAYFQNLLSANSLQPKPNCTESTNFSPVNTGEEVCLVDRAAGDYNPTSSGEINILAGQKRVIFVKGNLVINDSIKVANGGFLAFIVSGNITVDGEFGNKFNDSGFAGDERLEGVYIADGRITIDTDPTTVTNPDIDIFNDNPHCDRQALLNGTFVAWGEDGDGRAIDMKRTFKGCSLNPGSLSYTDWNCSTPATIITYRPNLLVNMPEWMRQSTTIRTEVI